MSKKLTIEAFVNIFKADGKMVILKKSTKMKQNIIKNIKIIQNVQWCWKYELTVINKKATAKNPLIISYKLNIKSFISRQNVFINYVKERNYRVLFKSELWVLLLWEASKEWLKEVCFIIFKSLYVINLLQLHCRRVSLRETDGRKRHGRRRKRSEWVHYFLNSSF